MSPSAESKARRGSRALARAGAALLALVAALVLGEVVVRLALADEWDTARLARFSLGTLMRLSDDAELVIELKPGLRETHGRGFVVTDERGRRVPEGGPVPTPPALAGMADPAHLVVVGDSTCFGWALPFALGYPERLRARLERTWRRPVRLTNLCVPGYNAAQELRVLETHLLEDPPDLIIWHYDHNDSMPPLHFPGAEASLPPTYGDNLLGSALLKVVLRRMAHPAPAEETGRDTLLSGYLTEGPDFEAHFATLRRLGELVRHHELPLLVVVFDAILERTPAGSDAHYERLHVRLLEEIDAAGLAVLDLHGPLQDLMDEQGWDDLRPLWLSTDPMDAHPNRLGHTFIANTIADHVTSRPGGSDGPPVSLH